MNKRTSQLKKSPLKKKRKSPEQAALEVEESTRQWRFFSEIWSERPHYSEVSGKWLGNEINSCFFDHLLEKGTDRYAHLRYEKENILLVTPDEHAAKTNGFPLPKHKEAIEAAKIKFNVL